MPRKTTTPLHPEPRWDWQDAAACRGEDLELFFGPDGEREPERKVREAEAKQVCAVCPVRRMCLEYALTKPEKYGTWGGKTDNERVTLRRRGQREAAAERRAVAA